MDPSYGGGGRHFQQQQQHRSQAQRQLPHTANPQFQQQQYQQPQQAFQHPMAPNPLALQTHPYPQNPQLAQPLHPHLLPIPGNLGPPNMPRVPPPPPPQSRPPRALGVDNNSLHPPGMHGGMHPIVQTGFAPPQPPLYQHPSSSAFPQNHVPRPNSSGGFSRVGSRPEPLPPGISGPSQQMPRPPQHQSARPGTVYEGAPDGGNHRQFSNSTPFNSNYGQMTDDLDIDNGSHAQPHVHSQHGIGPKRPFSTSATRPKGSAPRTSWDRPVVPPRQHQSLESRAGWDDEPVYDQEFSSRPSSNEKPDALKQMEEPAPDSLSFMAPGYGRRPPVFTNVQELYEKTTMVGEGTYGKVYKAIHKTKNITVALKRVRIEADKEGFPITGIREIKILSSLSHKNVMKLLEIFTEERDGQSFVHLVLEYMDHDLTGVFNNPYLKWESQHIKCLLTQLLEGLSYLHSKGVVHRDLKGSNLLLNREGVLKLGDFGLARCLAVPRMDYTNRVITLWYRPPELLLGSTQYGPEIDMWSAGCIMAEMLVKKPLFPGNDEISQLDHIWRLCGTPTKESWKAVTAMPWWSMVRPKEQHPRTLRDHMKRFIVSHGLKLLDSLLQLDPTNRPSASTCLLHPYFTEEYPPACDKSQLPRIEGDWHEYESKQRKKKGYLNGPDSLRPAESAVHAEIPLEPLQFQPPVSPLRASAPAIENRSPVVPDRVTATAKVVEILPEPATARAAPREVRNGSTLPPRTHSSAVSVLSDYLPKLQQSQAQPPPPPPSALPPDARDSRAPRQLQSTATPQNQPRPGLRPGSYSLRTRYRAKSRSRSPAFPRRSPPTRNSPPRRNDGGKGSSYSSQRVVRRGDSRSPPPPSSNRGKYSDRSRRRSPSSSRSSRSRTSSRSRYSRSRSRSYSRSTSRSYSRSRSRTSYSPSRSRSVSRQRKRSYSSSRSRSRTRYSRRNRSPLPRHYSRSRSPPPPVNTRPLDARPPREAISPQKPKLPAFTKRSPTRIGPDSRTQVEGNFSGQKSPGKGYQRSPSPKGPHKVPYSTVADSVDTHAVESATQVSKPTSSLKFKAEPLLPSSPIADHVFYATSTQEDLKFATSSDPKVEPVTVAHSATLEPYTASVPESSDGTSPLAALAKPPSTTTQVPSSALVDQSASPMTGLEEEAEEEVDSGSAPVLPVPILLQETKDLMKTVEIRDVTTVVATAESTSGEAHGLPPPVPEVSATVKRKVGRPRKTPLPDDSASKCYNVPNAASSEHAGLGKGHQQPTKEVRSRRRSSTKIDVIISGVESDSTAQSDHAPTTEDGAPQIAEMSDEQLAKKLSEVEPLRRSSRQQSKKPVYNFDALISARGMKRSASSSGRGGQPAKRGRRAKSAARSDVDEHFVGNGNPEAFSGNAVGGTDGGVDPMDAEEPAQIPRQEEAVAAADSVPAGLASVGGSGAITEVSLPTNVAGNDSVSLPEYQAGEGATIREESESLEPTVEHEVPMESGRIVEGPVLLGNEDREMSGDPQSETGPA